MTARLQFHAEKDLAALSSLIPEILSLADSEKEALGFWPEAALREAIVRQRLFAMTVTQAGNTKLAGYLHFSGVFPHAKIQQVAVLPKYRKCGVAAALVSLLASDLERLGFMTIKAEVASDLAGSLAFYARNRFVISRQRPGGQARGGTILVHVRQLETDSLFTAASLGDDSIIDLGIRRRSVGDTPLFAVDLNIYFDLVRDRAFSEKARQLFGAALSHEMRLAIADEFVNELRRTSTGNTADPVLQMALRLPRLPAVDLGQLDSLTENIHDMVFVTARSTAAGTAQALSDARHLAHAALARASAFITRDGAILAARNALLAKIGIDVATLEELVSLLPRNQSFGDPDSIQGDGFESAEPSAAEARSYLQNIPVPSEMVEEFASDEQFGATFKRLAIKESSRIVAIGVIKLPNGMEPVARLLTIVNPDHVSAEMFADHLLDTLTRFASSECPTAVELMHLPGQVAVNIHAQARGFLRSGSERIYLKAAMGRPLTAATWPTLIQQLRRRTGLVLPEKMPNTEAECNELTLITSSKKSFRVTASKMETILSPTIIPWPGRCGVIVPIGRSYADDLLGSGIQGKLGFIKSQDAAFLSQRSYVNSPRSAGLMRPDSLILFYESSRTGGRAAIVAVARIVDSVVSRKSDVSSDSMKRLVVDDVDSFSASEDVLVTAFDNIFVLPKPVPLGTLKKIGAAGKANLISASPISSENISEILTQGWTNAET